MTRAILDTNIPVQYLISSPRSAAVRTIEAYYAGRFRLVCSQATLDELLELLMHPRIRQRHGLSDNEALDFLESSRRHSSFANSPDRRLAVFSLGRGGDSRKTRFAR